MGYVAPRAGAWIETRRLVGRGPVPGSPPARGRGLKPTAMLTVPSYVPSPPARGRGLKRVGKLDDAPARGVAPRAGAWIETLLARRAAARTSSPPARGRGLKHIVGDTCGELPVSPPARGRGLKPALAGRHPCGPLVAPRAGAWIETGNGWPPPATRTSPPARGRGLKLSRQTLSQVFWGRPPRGGVD